MPHIASHHRADPYTPSDDWPEACLVQWGDSGLVLRSDGSAYGTAFFEAFPEASGFIRGEGATVAEAEARALEQYRRASACDHVWGRDGYTNGGGRCKRCKTFRGGQFAPIVTLGAWRRPLDASDLDFIAAGALRREPGDPPLPDEDRFLRRLELRARRMGIALPPLPEASAADRSLLDPPDAYERACRRAVADWWRAHPPAGPDAPTPGTANGFFDLLARRSLDRLLAAEDGPGAP